MLYPVKLSNTVRLALALMLYLFLLAIIKLVA